MNQTLYRTDGTASGTTIVSNAGYNPYHMTVLGNKLVYQAYYPYTAIYPCSSEPLTDFVTVLIKVEGGVASVLKYPVTVSKCGIPAPLGNTFINTSKFIQSSNYLYFRGQTENVGGYTAYNLWRTDGTTEGTIQLTNFASGSNEGVFGSMFDAYTSDYNFTSIAYFPIYTSAAGAELWRSDGSVAGTYLLKDINPGINGSGVGAYNGTGNPNTSTGPVEFRTVNGITYFFANDGTNGMELWKTDGTTNGTQMVQNLNPTGGQPINNAWDDNVYGTSVGSTYFFSGDNGVQKGLYSVSSVIPVTLALTVDPSPICVGSTANLSVVTSGGTPASPDHPYSYTWAAPAGVTLSGTSTSAVTATATTSGVKTFTVTVAPSDGTPASTSTVSLTVTEPPTVSISAFAGQGIGLNLTQGQSTTLTASGATSYVWSNGARTASIPASTGGTYSVTGTTGACWATASTLVTVTSLGANGPSCDSYTNKTTADGLGGNSVRAVYGAGSTVFAATDGGLSISTNGGTTFTNKNTTNGLPIRDVRGVYAVGSRIYAATWGGGLAISTDGGNTFSTKTTDDGLGSSFVAKVFAVGNTVYAATYGGLSLSGDGGNTFINKYFTGAGNISVNGVYAVGTTVYAACGGYYSFEGGLKISVDGGNSFITRTTADGLGDNWVNAVYAVGSTVYAATDKGLSISTDGGRTFLNRTMANGLGSNGVRGVYVVGNTVYAATVYEGGGSVGGLSISTDGGNTFTNSVPANVVGGSIVRGVHTMGSTIYAATDGGLAFCASTNPCSGVTAAITGSQSVCAGQTTKLSATGGTSYVWNTGATSATILAPAGNYTVTVTSNGCSASATTTVTATTLAAPALTTASRSLTTSTIPLLLTGFATADNGNTLQFTTTGGTLLNPPTASIAQTGVQNFLVSQTNGVGCVSPSTPLGLTVTEAPRTVSASASKAQVCVSGTTSLSVDVSALPAGSKTYLWQGPAGVSFSGNTLASPTVTFSTAGVKSFTVTVTASGGKYNGSVSVTAVALPDAPSLTGASRSFVVANNGAPEQFRHGHGQQCAPFLQYDWYADDG